MHNNVFIFYLIFKNKKSGVLMTTARQQSMRKGSCDVVDCKQCKNKPYGNFVTIIISF